MEHVRQLDDAGLEPDGKERVREMLTNSPLRQAQGTTNYDRWQQAIVRQYDEWTRGNTLEAVSWLMERLYYEGRLAIVDM